MLPEKRAFATHMVSRFRNWKKISCREVTVTIPFGIYINLTENDAVHPVPGLMVYGVRHDISLCLHVCMGRTGSPFTLDGLDIENMCCCD